MSKTIIPKEELDRLNKLSTDLIIALDPAPILDALRIEYTVHRNGTEYLFKSHSESTPSTRFKLFDNGWGYTNFANRQNSGVVIGLIQNYMGISKKEAYQYCYDYLPGARNYSQEALEIEKITNKYSFNMEEKIKELELLKEENKIKSEKYSSTSKVSKAYEIYKNNANATEFLEKRGLDKIPPFLMMIKGEYEKFDVETGELQVRYQTGIGVLTGNIKEHLKKIQNKEEFEEDLSGDIHYFKAFTKKDGTVGKTQSFGEKTFSYWLTDNPKNKKSVMIFESKMDAVAAYCENQNIWKDYNVIIANGVGTFQEISNFINEQNFDEIINFNQFDFAAIQFIVNIMENTSISPENYKYIKYNEDEYKLDINDLYKNKISIESRFEKNKGFKDHLMTYLKYVERTAKELTKTVKNHVSPELAEYDEKILRILGSTKKDITEFLFDGEKNRYQKLLDKGFIKDEEKKTVLSLNIGKSIEDLEILHEAKVKNNEKHALTKILINLGVNMAKEEIKNIDDLKRNLSLIDLASDDEYENLNGISEYLEKNKKDKDVIQAMEEWVKYICENNSKLNIERANAFYLQEFQEALNKKFKLINIGINLGQPAPIVEEAKEIDLTFNEDTFVPVDLTNQNNEIEEKILSAQPEFNPTKKTPEPTIGDAIAEALNKPPLRIKPNMEKFIDVEYEFNHFQTLLEEINVDLKDAVNIKEEKTDDMKKIVIKETKTICSTIWDRLNDENVKKAILNEDNPEKKKALAEKRIHISNQCKENFSLIEKVENSLIQENKEILKIDTSKINSKQLVDELTSICSKVHNTVSLMKQTLLEIKKNNEASVDTTNLVNLHR